MKIAANSYDNTAFAIANAGQKKQNQEDETKGSLSLGGDTINISETGKELSSIMSANKAQGNNEETPDTSQEEYGAAAFAELEQKAAARKAASSLGRKVTYNTGASKTKQPEKIKDDRKDDIEKQIKEIQAQIAKAKEKVQQSQTATGPAANTNEPEDESPEATAAQLAVDTLTNQLMQLQQELVRNSQTDHGFKGSAATMQPVAVGGSGLSGTIGSAVDPYAAAQAAEAAEMGGGAAPAAPEALATPAAPSADV